MWLKLRLNKFGKFWLSVLSKVELVSLSLCLFVTVRYLFTRVYEAPTIDEFEKLSQHQKELQILLSNVYYVIERVIEMHAMIITYILLGSAYRKVALIASTITTMSFINQVLIALYILEIDNIYYLLIEFLLIFFVLWRVSKVSY